MARERGETERRATVLQDRLSAFARLDGHDQKPRLKELVDFITATTTRDIVRHLVDREFQQRLAIAVSDLAQTPFDVDGRLIIRHPWITYTAVVLDSHGNVVGAVEQPCADGLDRHKFALAKALCASHLDKAGMQGGLGKSENLGYLARKTGVKPLEAIFMGSSQEPIQLGENKLYLGAGGCELNPFYRRMLLGLELEGPAASAAYYKQDGLISTVLRNTQAGEVDNAFCDEVEIRFTNPYALVTIGGEPSRLREIRLKN